MPSSNTVQIRVQGNKITATFDSKTVMSVNIPSLSSPHGFVAVGPDRFGVASFDNLRITRADLHAAAEPVSFQHNNLQFLSRMKMKERNAIDRKPVDL